MFGEAINDHGIKIDARYASPRLMWHAGAGIQAHYCSKDPCRHAIQEETRREFIRRLESGAFVLRARACVLCEGTRFFKISDLDRMGLYFPMSICRTCGLVQANPVLRQQDYDEFYRCLYRSLMGAKKSGTEAILRNKANKRGGKLYDFLEKRKVLQQINSKTDLIVEVGCGDGAIVSYFHDRGYCIIGTDFDEQYMKIGRSLGYDLRCATISDIAAEKSPNIILYHHVLEHIVDINEHLKMVARATCDGAFVAVMLPGVKYIHKSYRGDFLQYVQCPHVFNFSLLTLEMLMRKFGFELVYGDEAIVALFRKKRSTAAPQARSEVFSVMHYLKNLETDYRKQHHSDE